MYQRGIRNRGIGPIEWDVTPYQTMVFHINDPIYIYIYIKNHIHMYKCQVRK